MKDCLIRLASHFEGYHASTFQGMTANQMAILLLKSQSKINKKLYYRQQLDKEIRKKSESILNAFTRVENLIRKIYPGMDNPEGKQSLLLQALVSFTTEPFSSNLDVEFTQAKLKGEEIDVYAAVKSLAKKELVKEYVVTSDLAFKRKPSKVPSQYAHVYNMELKRNQI